MFKKTLKTCSPFSLHVSVSKIIAIVYLIRNLVIIFIQPELFLNLQSRLWSDVFPTVPQCGLHCHPNMIFFPLITFSSRESKQLDKCPAPMSPCLSCLLSLTLFNPGKINGSLCPHSAWLLCMSPVMEEFYLIMLSDYYFYLSLLPAWLWAPWDQVWC